jgi:hypothetical protein
MNIEDNCEQRSLLSEEAKPINKNIEDSCEYRS